MIKITNGSDNNDKSHQNLQEEKWKREVMIKIRHEKKAKRHEDQTQQLRWWERETRSKSTMDNMKREITIKIRMEKIKKRKDDKNQQLRRWKREITIKITNWEDEKRNHIKISNVGKEKRKTRGWSK
jgi:uncharacterized UBP type Zn finger protein